MKSALRWALLIGFSEWAARRATRSRSHGWLLAYPIVGGLALEHGSDRARATRSSVPGPARTLLGAALAVGGYPLGRRLLGDRSDRPPPDPLPLELLSLSTVAAAEELSWGGRVEPGAGIAWTGLFFTLKHVLLDRRWRRSLGLFSFWYGLGLLRRRSPRLALAVHIACNAGGVAIGHLIHRDQF